jgi:hypothetical protein
MERMCNMAIESFFKLKIGFFFKMVIYLATTIFSNVRVWQLYGFLIANVAIEDI